MPIEAIGIVGSGTEAVALAHTLALRGAQVRLFDLFRDNLRAASARIEWALRRENRPDLAKLIEPVQETAKLAGADMIIEAEILQPENRAAFISKIAQKAGPGCVIAVKCGVEPVTPLFDGLEAPERFMGINFHPPLKSNRLAGIVRPSAGSDVALEACVKLARDIGKTTVLAHDNPGVIVERLRRPFLLAALSLLESGKGLVHQIDDAVKTAGGLPQGPFEMADYIGIDRDFQAATAIYKLLGKPDRLKPSAGEDRLVQYGQMGRRTTVGFYIYDEGAISGENPVLRDMVSYLGISPAAPERIFAKIMRSVADEARLLAAECMVSEFDIETAAKLAFGWPKGPLAFARELGDADAQQNRPLDQWGDAV